MKGENMSANTGLTEGNSLKKILLYNKELLEEKFSNNNTFAAESFFDNFVTAISCCSLFIQNKIDYANKQFDTLTADLQYLGALCQRIGLSRIPALHTQLYLQIKGEPQIHGDASSVIIKNTRLQVEFENCTEFTTNENGIAQVKFKCLILTPIEVAETDSFEIVHAPDGISSVETAEKPEITIGYDAEDDTELRQRFINATKLNKKLNRDGIFRSLKPFIEHNCYLKILSPFVDNNMDAGTIKIIAYHNTTDEIFANAIFNCTTLGIKTIGNTTVIVYDNNRQEIPICFEKPQEIDITIQATLKIKSGYYKNSIISKIKNNIQEYIKQHVYGLGCSIYSSEFTIPILKTDGIEAVYNTQIKSSLQENYSDNIKLLNTQIPIFSEERIVLNDN